VKEGFWVPAYLGPKNIHEWPTIEGVIKPPIYLSTPESDTKHAFLMAVPAGMDMPDYRQSIFFKRAN